MKYTILAVLINLKEERVAHCFCQKKNKKDVNLKNYLSHKNQTST